MTSVVRLPQEANANCIMVVTGRSLIVSGMVTAPPEPMYLVMVIAPLLVV
jgi:hypothetical protein